MKKNIENYYLTFENLTDTELVNGGYFGCEGTADVSLYEKKTNKLLIKERKNIRFNGTTDDTIYEHYFDTAEETIEEQFGAKYAHIDDEEDEKKYDEIEQNRWEYVEENTDEWFGYYFDEMYQYYDEEEEFSKQVLIDYDDIIEEMIEDYFDFGINEDFDYVVDSSTFVKGNRKVELSFKYTTWFADFKSFRKLIQSDDDPGRINFTAFAEDINDDCEDEELYDYDAVDEIENLSEPLTIDQINDFVMKIKKEEFINKGWKEVKAA